MLRSTKNKAGQKKVTNFSACRDLNGRRLRHVEAEAQIAEWNKNQHEVGLQISIDWAVYNNEEPSNQELSVSRIYHHLSPNPSTYCTHLLAGQPSRYPEQIQTHPGRSTAQL